MSAAKFLFVTASLFILSALVVVGAFGLNILVYSMTDEASEPIEAVPVVETVSVRN